MDVGVPFRCVPPMSLADSDTVRRKRRDDFGVEGEDEAEVDAAFINRSRIRSRSWWDGSGFVSVDMGMGRCGTVDAVDMDEAAEFVFMLF